MTNLELTEKPGWKDLFDAQVAGIFITKEQHPTGTSAERSDSIKKHATKLNDNKGVLKPSSFQAPPANNINPTPAPPVMEVPTMEMSTEYSEGREIDSPNFAHYITLKFKEDYTDTPADFVLTSMACAFNLLFKHVAGCKIWHREGSSRKSPPSVAQKIFLRL